MNSSVDVAAMNVSDNSSSGASSPSDSAAFGFYIEGLVLTLVSTFGLVGNGLSIVVLFQRAFRSSFSGLLKGLAFCDALFLLMAMAAFGLPELSTWYNNYVLARVAPILFGLLHTFRVGSVYVTMAVTLERFFAVASPLRSYSSKKYLLPSALLFAFVYNMPKYFEVQSQWDEEKQAHTIVATELRNNPIYVTYYVVWSKMLLTDLFPYFTILVLNIVIIFKTIKASTFRSQFHAPAACRRHSSARLSQAPQQGNGHLGTPTRARLRSDGDSEVGVTSEITSTAPRQGSLIARMTRQTSGGNQAPIRSPPTGHSNSSSSSSSERDLIRVLIGISLLFLVCQSLKVLPDVYELLFCRSEARCLAPDFVLLVAKLSHLLVCINSASNFLIYLLQGAKFRRAFQKTFVHCNWKDAFR